MKVGDKVRLKYFMSNGYDYFYDGELIEIVSKINYETFTGKN